MEYLDYKKKFLDVICPFCKSNCYFVFLSHLTKDNPHLLNWVCSGCIHYFPEEYFLFSQNRLNFVTLIEK